MDAALASLLAPRTLVLPIPYSTAAASSTTTSNTIDGVEAIAEAQRRQACAHAAAVRAGEAEDSDDDDIGSDGDDDDPSVSVHTLRVRTLPVAASIGGKLWDASLLMGAWLHESPEQFPPPAADGQPQKCSSSRCPSLRRTLATWAAPRYFMIRTAAATETPLCFYSFHVRFLSR